MRFASWRDGDLRFPSTQIALQAHPLTVCAHAHPRGPRSHGDAAGPFVAPSGGEVILDSVTQYATSRGSVGNFKNANPNYREPDLPGSLVLFPHLGTRRCVVFLILVRRMNSFPIRCNRQAQDRNDFPLALVRLLNGVGV